ncbi:MAG: hypothetical protein ACTHN2_21245 [Nitrobacter sp.]
MKAPLLIASMANGLCALVMLSIFLFDAGSPLHAGLYILNAVLAIWLFALASRP